MANKITLKNDVLKKYLTEKGKLISEGIKKSEEIEEIEKQMTEIDEKIQAHEKTVNIDDLHEKEREQSEIVAQAVTAMNEIHAEIISRLKENAPTELYTQHENLVKDKEKLEEERNKIAIKAQKYNDKIIPLGRKAMTPYLRSKYDDYETLSIENGEVVCTIFNHVDDFKKNFKHR